MAAKKRAKAPVAKAKPRAKPGPGRRQGRECVPPEICKYLKELGVWLTWFRDDYEKLRIAMCNVEAEAFSGTGVASKRFPPCGGGSGGDPTPPQKPPIWT